MNRYFIVGFAFLAGFVGVEIYAAAQNSILIALLGLTLLMTAIPIGEMGRRMVVQHHTQRLAELNTRRDGITLVLGILTRDYQPNIYTDALSRLRDEIDTDIGISANEIRRYNPDFPASVRR